MLHGIIIVPVADLRLKPDWESERLSQVMFGTAVIIEDIRKDFSLVKIPEGYKGWCRNTLIDQVAFARWQNYLNKPKYRIKSETARVRHDQNPQAQPFRLYFGTELALIRHSERIRFTLPNGYRATISKSALAEPRLKNQPPDEKSKIIRTARRFLGVPYLWGGITPAGYDCSGLVQMVYRFHGIELPRDSGQQRLAGYEIARSDIQTGDLLFFPRHIAIAVDKHKIIHASASRGMVISESLRKGDDNYRDDLDKQFETARRVP